MSDQTVSNLAYALGSVLIPFLAFFYGFSHLRRDLRAPAVASIAIISAWLAQWLVVTSLGETSPWVVASAIGIPFVSTLAATVIVEASRADRAAIGPWWSYYWRIAVVYLMLVFFSGAVTTAALVAAERTQWQPVLSALVASLCFALATYLVFLRFAKRPS